MKKQKKESAQSFVLKDGKFTLTATRSNAKQRKARAPTGRMSTPKVPSGYCTKPVCELKDLWDEEYRLRKSFQAAADELLWRYKARGAIIQNLLSILTLEGCKISGNLTGSILKVTRLRSGISKAPSIYETGPTRISKKSSAYNNADCDCGIRAD